jgi:hypothetical protein
MVTRIRHKKVTIPRYDRKEKHYTIDEVLSQTVFVKNYKKNPCKVNFDGEWINMGSHRYQCFVLYGTTCVDCGLEAQYFIMERQGHFGQFHFNLYGLDDQGNEILFTKDHVVPRSRGGKDELKNYQPMCTICNNKKGSELIYPVNRWLIPAYV